MEFEYRDETQRRGRWTILLGVALAVFAGAAAFLLISQAQKQAGQAGLQTVPIVVAARDIPARKPLDLEDLTVRDVPLDETNSQGVFTDPSKIVGLISGVPILKDQPVYANLLAAQAAGGGQFSILEPGELVTETSEAWRAVSVTVPDDRAVGGLVGAGDTVDVFMTVTVQVPQPMLELGRYYTDKSTKITYQNVLVLAKSGTFYVLKVPSGVAEEISHMQASGAAGFSLALRPALDTRTLDVSRLGETTNMLIRRYGLPVPEVYPGTGPVATPSPAPSPVLDPNASPAPGSSASPAPGASAAP